MVELDSAHACLFRLLRSVYEYSQKEIAEAVIADTTTIFEIEHAVKPIRKVKDIVVMLCDQYGLTFDQMEAIATHIRKIGIIDFHRQSRLGFVALILAQAGSLSKDIEL